MPVRLGLATKLWYGSGQLAEGAKNAAFGSFLLLFYSQVLGLPAYLGGVAMVIALAIDAVTDPMAGSLSDALRHRWGRRHPFMYASALPMGITFALVFRPPAGLEMQGLFAWMLVFTVLARLSMTLYHVPHLALGAELSSDYQERTVVVAYRTVAGILGAAALFLVSREVFMRPSQAYPDGQLDPSAYPPMGLFFGAWIAVAILSSALGTHARIPQLPKPAADVAPFSLRRLAGELRDALRNPSFRMLFLGLLVFFVARGTEGVLTPYMATFFWGLDTGDVLLIPVAGLVGVILGTPVWALVSRWVDKRVVFLVGVVWFSVFTTLLPPLEILGLYFERGHALYVPTIYAVVFLAALGAAGGLVAAGSMLADVADEHDLAVGRRQEGIFFGALAFAGKAATGLGNGLGGAALTLIDFPLQVAPAAVPPETVRALGVVAGPGVSLLTLVGIVLMSRYRLTRERVREVQVALAARCAAGDDPQV